MDVIEMRIMTSRITAGASHHHLCEISLKYPSPFRRGPDGNRRQGMVPIDGKNARRPSRDTILSGGHQRIAATVSCLGKRMSYRIEIHLGTHSDGHVIIALPGKYLFGAIRVAVLQAISVIRTWASAEGLKNLRGRECARYGMSFQGRLSEK